MLAAHLGNDAQIVIDERMLDALTECTRENLFCRVEFAGLQCRYSRGHLSFKRGRRRLLRRALSCGGDKQEQKDLAAQASQKRSCRRHRCNRTARRDAQIADSINQRRSPILWKQSDPLLIIVSLNYTIPRERKAQTAVPDAIALANSGSGSCGFVLLFAFRSCLFS